MAHVKITLSLIIYMVTCTWRTYTDPRTDITNYLSDGPMHDIV